MTSVSLVCMPWAMVRSPSIAVGLLHARLVAAGVDVRSHSFHIAFADHLLGRAPRGGRLTLEEYDEVCSLLGNLGAGDWVFAVPPTRPASRANDERFAALLRGAGKRAAKFVSKLRRTRELVPTFLDRCADEVLAGEPDVVGFTSVYSQTWPSAALAHVLKQRRPDLKVVLGGASCEGPMGRATLEALSWIDAVARGECDDLAVELVEALAHGGDLAVIPRLCWREGSGAVRENDLEGEPVDLDTVPVPDYYEYFERLGTTEHLAVAVEVQLPYETSRGCWWGAKHHCTFCGLNGMEMAARAKSPENALAGIEELCARHHLHDLTVVDNILPLEYFDTLLPRLAAGEHDVSLFYEVKANLSRERVALLRRAGVRTIQPGIESLSTNVLRLMRKGVTALQNARLLKWSAEEGIHVIWNLLYGFPGETAEDYERTAAWIPALVHLTPPNLSELALYRFSPYFEAPEEHGLAIEAPLPWYELLFDLDEAGLADLAQSFRYRHLDGRAPAEHLGAVAEEVERWRRDADRNYRALQYRRGPGFVTITDARTTTANGRGVLRYELEGAHAAAFLACEGGAKVSGVVRALAAAGVDGLDAAGVEAFCAELVDARLAVRDGDRYLTLALSNR